MEQLIEIWQLSPDINPLMNKSAWYWGKKIYVCLYKRLGIILHVHHLQPKLKNRPQCPYLHSVEAKLYFCCHSVAGPHKINVLFNKGCIVGSIMQSKNLMKCQFSLKVSADVLGVSSGVSFYFRSSACAVFFFFANAFYSCV